MNNTKFQWTKSDNSSDCVVKSTPQQGVLVIIGLERNKLSDDVYLPQEFHDAFYWHIQILDKKGLLTWHCFSWESDVYPDYCSLEQCEENAENFFYGEMINELKDLLISAQARVKACSQALKILTGKTK